MKTITDIITEQGFFKDLAAEQIQALAENARYRRFRANELIFHDGNLANRFYVIVDGAVVLEALADDGHTVQFQTAGVGELLGWSWAYTNSLHRLRARALRPTEVIYFSGQQLHQQCDQDNSLGYQLFRQLADVLMNRLQAMRQLLLEKPALAPVATSEWRPGER